MCAMTGKSLIDCAATCNSKVATPVDSPRRPAREEVCQRVASASSQNGPLRPRKSMVVVEKDDDIFDFGEGRNKTAAQKPPEPAKDMKGTKSSDDEPRT